MKLIVPSPAKINLSLWVKGKRDDGYHEIVTVMHTVNLYDLLTFYPSDRLELEVEGRVSIPLGRSNLITKAARVFREATGIDPKVKIKLKKEIPVGAGLGGGSSNAAATLKGLNAIYGNPLAESELIQIASRIGSDVPFFIKGGLAIAYGRGEKLKTYPPAKFKLLLIYPEFSCSTAEVYGKLPVLERQISIEDAERLIVAPLISGNLQEVIKNMENDLEKSGAPCIKEVEKVKCEIGKLGLKPLMSGSGSSVFAIVDNDFPDVSHLKEKESGNKNK